MTLISKNCQKSVTKNQLGHSKLLTDTPNIVCSVQSALSPHKHWAERHFASEFGTQHLGGGRSTGLTASPPHPGRPLRGLPIGQADGDQDPTPGRSPDLRQVFFSGRDGKSSTACLCPPAGAPLRGGAGNTQGSGQRLMPSPRFWPRADTADAKDRASSASSAA